LGASRKTISYKACAHIAAPDVDGKGTYETLRDLIRELQVEPEKKGDALRPPLAGLYSLHSSRFRVIYRGDGKELKVLVGGAGHHESGSTYRH
jgi:mRNA-degrading endonuclease RelE of RelBE toxin-antitoxin system